MSRTVHHSVCRHSLSRHDVDCAVIGAGAVGLAVARALALAGREVVVLEAEGGIGTQVSARSSEVIHAGLYYPPGSLKARLCVEGRRRLYEYCASRGIAHRRLGKLVVAVEDGEITALEDLAERARANGVEDIEWLDAAACRAREPALRARAALFSGQSGVFDSHAFMLALQGEIEDQGGRIALRAPVTGGEITAGGGGDLEIGGPEPVLLSAGLVVNAAGLSAHRVAASIGGMPDQAVPAVRYAKGNYFAYRRSPPFRHLIYPLPQDGGLGVHLTLDLAGRGRFGPDIEWIEDAGERQEPDWSVDPRRVAAFIPAIRRYFPRLAADDLLPGYAGLRPKLSGPGEAAADFRIDGPAVHGAAGWINLFGIESPGLTAALAIGEAVEEQINSCFDNGQNKQN